MNKPLVIFGTGKIAEVVLYLFGNCSDRTIVACTTDREYLPGNSWNGLPAFPFEQIEETHPPRDFDMFIALGYQDMNRLRAEKYDLAKSMGYKLPSYIDPASSMPGDCEYGENCFIMNNVHIHPCVRLGNNVFVWSGALIGHHSTVGDNCWLTSCSNISGGVRVGKNCFLAVNSTVGNSVELGDNCFVGANALITKCTKSDEVYLQESNKPYRLNSQQFLRITQFADF